MHAVLERLFDLPAAERTVEAAASLLRPEWDRLVEAEPAVAGLFAGEDDLGAWLGTARSLLEGYFTLEDPQRLEPARREEHVQVVLPSGLRLRGIVDRVDVAPSGAVRVVDYKTGRAPGEAVRGQGAVPDEVLRAGAVAHDGRGAGPAAADVPRRPGGAALLPRRGRPAGHRAQAARAVGGDRAGDGRAGVPAPARPAVRLVRPPGAVPVLRRHAAAVPRRGALPRLVPGAGPAPAAAAGPAGGVHTGRSSETGATPAPVDRHQEDA